MNMAALEVVEVSEEVESDERSVSKRRKRRGDWCCHFKTIQKRKFSFGIWCNQKSLEAKSRKHFNIESKLTIWNGMSLGVLKKSMVEFATAWQFKTKGDFRMAVNENQITYNDMVGGCKCCCDLYKLL